MGQDFSFSKDIPGNKCEMFVVVFFFTYIIFECLLKKFLTIFY